MGWLDLFNDSEVSNLPNYLLEDYTPAPTNDFSFLTSGDGLSALLGGLSSRADGSELLGGWAGFNTSPESLTSYAVNQVPDTFASVPVQPFAPTEQGSGGFFDALGGALDKAGTYLQTPGGKLAAGLGGAGISAYGALKQKKLMAEAIKKQQEMLAARQAQSTRYNEPLRLTNARTAVEAPQARRGETAFFANNRLPSYYAGGGAVREDTPSVMGFLRYLAAGKKLPSEVREAKEAARRPPQQPVTPVARGGYIDGGTAGQADKIPAMLSDGEYVMDADVVSALGDGNNAAGAKKLDQMRENVRYHKRGAPTSKIPPKAKSPLAYMKKGK